MQIAADLPDGGAVAHSGVVAQRDVYGDDVRLGRRVRGHDLPPKERLPLPVERAPGPGHLVLLDEVVGDDPADVDRVSDGQRRSVGDLQLVAAVGGVGDQREHVDHRLATRDPAAPWQSEDPGAEDPALVGEEQHRRVGGGHEEVLDEVRGLRRHAALAPAPATLGPVLLHLHPLDVALVGHGDDHVLDRDQVLQL